MTVKSAISSALSLWAKGAPAQALAALERAEELIDAGPEENGLATSLHHAACLVLHDLEKNDQVIYHANKCIKSYKQTGNRQSEVITRVNLGDALWGIGHTKSALQTLEKAYAEATDCQQPHAQSIAAICLANVKAAGGFLDKANSLYEEGLRIAGEMENDWDKIYGAIYQTLSLHEAGASSGTDRLIEISRQPATAKYPYLQALSTSMAVVSAVQMKDSNRALKLVKEGLTSKAINVFPLTKSYLNSAAILLTEEPQPDLVREFLHAVARCNGIKGRPTLILEALNKVEKQNQLTPVEQQFVVRWKARFDWRKADDDQELRLAPCDYRKCEAQCCL